ncbi:T6SS immunity protein Tli4 family protein [Herbaspirillum rubrisubalbicans]|uniref:T6SS immunity protein Tli4 family protein n=1 Tax=Herbaspirillum rubrisubalbicans TaxID=80842 RepID=UPI0020A67D5C|nr:T6SS immunity protein Tli4 family protein [Herbaspirillum rubrisubalbicans]
MSLVKRFYAVLILALMSTSVLSEDISENRGLDIMMGAHSSQPVPAISTFCTGRFLLDMPAGSVLSGGNYRYDFARLDKPKAMSLEEFEAEMAAKENTLRSTKHKVEPNLLRFLVKPDPQSWIFVYWEKGFITSVVQVDGYRWIDGTRYLFKAEAGHGKPATGTRSYQDNTVERVRKILSSLHKRSTHEIPTEPGYCFEDGFIANPKWEMEEAGIDIDIAGHPDAFVSVWFYPLAMRAHSQPLLDRMGGVLQMLGRMATSVHVLRRGDRQVGPYKGQEFLVKRMRAGFEWPADVILGRNGAECTAVMANAPGPLELLPTAQYKTWSNRGERHWLRVSYVGIGQRGFAEEMESFLGEGDPYAKIYLNNTSDWWKLIREDLIDPAGREDREAIKAGETVALDKDIGKADFDRFALNLQKARDLHAFIRDKYHARTYAYYAADHQRPSWNEVQWKCPVSLPDDIKTAMLRDDDLNGEIFLNFKKGIARRFVLQEPTGPGDGTVPAESGAVPTPYVLQMFKHEGKAKGP